MELALELLPVLAVHKLEHRLVHHVRLRIVIRSLFCLVTMMSVRGDWGIDSVGMQWAWLLGFLMDPSKTSQSRSAPPYKFVRALGVHSIEFYSHM